MYGLPVEISQEILLHSSIDKLETLSMSSPLFYDICHSSSFWRRRFKELNIPLEIGDRKLSLGQWLRLARNAEETNNLLEEMKRKGSKLKVPLTSSAEEREALSEVSFFFFYFNLLPRIEKIEEEYINAEREEEYYNEKYEQERNYATLAHAQLYSKIVQSLIKLRPTLSLFYKEGSFFYSLEGAEVSLCRDEMWKLVFRLLVYLVPFHRK